MLIETIILEVSTANLIVIASIVMSIAILNIVYRNIINRLVGPKLDTSVIIIFSVIMGLSAIFTFSSVAVESVPVNHFVEKVDGQNMSILIDREPTILIPLKTVAPFSPRSTLIQASINHDDNITIEAVKLSTSDSILSYPEKFDFVNSTSVSGSKRDQFSMVAYSNHNLDINNSTKLYTIDVIYSNSTNNKLQKWSVPFSWPIKSMNMSIFAYFWIVLIGVLVSRLLSLILDKLDKIQQTQDQKTKDLITSQAIVLNINDYVWITFSFIIAILIFSSFNQQVELTTNIVINISLAFGFGFGFDKVLEVAKRFQST